MVRRICSGCVATSNPLTLALPEVGVSNPQSTRIVVDFPAPLGPRKPKISPLDTSRETWSTATNEPKVLTRSVIWTAVMGAPGRMTEPAESRLQPGLANAAYFLQRD